MRHAVHEHFDIDVSKHLCMLDRHHVEVGAAEQLSFRAAHEPAEGLVDEDEAESLDLDEDRVLYPSDDRPQEIVTGRQQESALSVVLAHSIVVSSRVKVHLTSQQGTSPLPLT